MKSSNSKNEFNKTTPSKELQVKNGNKTIDTIFNGRQSAANLHSPHIMKKKKKQQGKNISMINEISLASIQRTIQRSQTSLLNSPIKNPQSQRKEDRTFSEANNNNTDIQSIIGEKRFALGQSMDNGQNDQKKNIRVYARFRPVNDLENSLLDNGVGWLCPDYNPNNQLVTIMTRKSNLANSYSFALDRVFSSTIEQEEIYNHVGKEIVNDVLSGYNGTIFAYGQSGSGKTFTMYGNEIHDESLKGLIPRIVEQVFAYVNMTDDNVKFQFKLSVLQIYKEVIYDLLTGDKDLKIKENPTKGIYVDGITEVYLTNVDDFMYYADLSQANRIVSGTKLNQCSSRSHSIMILEVQQTFTNDNITKKGILNLVDLAGSEKISKTGAVGETLEEAKKINLSLSALGNVIHALTSSSEHIPYRDSKLTRILQESLGGNYKTSLVVTCSPHSYHLEETLSSLQFAQRAKTIKNKVKINIKLSYEELQKRIDKLTQQLSNAKEEINRLKNSKGIPINDQFNLNLQDSTSNNNNIREELSDFSSLKLLDVACPNCHDMTEKGIQLEKQLNFLQLEIKEKDDLIKELNTKLDQRPSSLPTQNLAELYDDIKSKFSTIIKDNSNLVFDSTERQKLSQQSLEINKTIFNHCFDFINNNNNTNSKVGDLFKTINDLVIKGIQDDNLTEFQSIYQQYKNNYVKIFDSFFSEDPAMINRDTMKYFLFEYIQFYFSYQLLQKTNSKLNEDNKSLSKMNTILSDIIEDLLSKNYELSNNVSSHANAFNKLKTSIIEGSYGKTFAGEHAYNITEMKDLFIDEMNKMSFVCDNNNIPRRASSKIQILVSKKNIDLMKNMKMSNMKSFINTNNHNNNNNSNAIVNEIIQSPKNILSNTSIPFALTQNQCQTPSNELFNSSDLNKLILQTECLPTNNNNVKKSDKKLSKFSMLKDVLVTSIKDGEKFKNTVNEIREEFAKIIGLNEKYVIEKLNEVDYLGDSSHKKRNMTMKLSNDEKEIDLKDFNDYQFYTGQFNGLISKECTIENNNNTTFHKKENSSKDLFKNHLKQKKVSEKKISPSSSLREMQGFSTGFKPREILPLSYSTGQMESLNMLYKNKNHLKIASEYNDKIFKPKASLMKLQINNEQQDECRSQIPISLGSPDDYANKMQKQSLEQLIEEYLETGTATRRFDGIKVHMNNSKVECLYSGGLNAENVINVNALQRPIICSMGDDASLLNESISNE